jgi:hypothetical protein
MMYSIYLTTIDELFEFRQANPLKQPYLLESGVDHLYKQLRVVLPKEESTVVVHLPEEATGMITPVVVREALSRFCEHRIQDVHDDYRMLRREGRKSLPVGLFFLSVCVVLAYLIQTEELFPGLAKFFVVEGLYIIGWVSMWKPVEVFLYEWWPYRRRVRVYRYMSTLDVVIANGNQASSKS